jgi:hypothetical protein
MMQQTSTMPIAIDAPPDALTTRALSTPQWKPIALLHVLRTWITSLTKGRMYERQDIRPDFPRQETPTDILARKHTFLYACSLSG